MILRSFEAYLYFSEQLNMKIYASGMLFKAYLHNKLFHLLSHLKYCLLWEVLTESPGKYLRCCPLHIMGMVHSLLTFWWV